MKTRRRLLIMAGLALLLLLAALVPHDFFSKPKQLKLTAGDLAVTKGQILSYSLLDDSRGIHLYTIHLSGYPATFQIPVDFAPYFAKSRFESDLKKGDSVSLSIPVANAPKLIAEGTIPVFAVRTASETYLDEHSTLDAYNIKNNPHKQVPALTPWVPFIVAASIILFIGLMFLIWKIARIIAARPRKPKTLSDPEALNESSQRLKKVLTKSAPQQKSLTMGDQKLLTVGDAEQELLATGDAAQKPGDPPQD